MKYERDLQRYHNTDTAAVLSNHNELLDDLLRKLREPYRIGSASSDVNAMAVERFWRHVRAGALRIEAALIAEGLRP